MTFLQLLILLLVAGICGAIGQAITGYSRGGLFASVGLGLVGAFLGLYAARALHLPELITITIGGATFPVVWSIIGAAVFVAVLSLFSRRRYYDDRRYRHS